jgi:hypothetical protein
MMMQAKKIAMPIGLAFAASLSIKSLTSIPISFPVDALAKPQASNCRHCADELADWRPD